MHSILPIRGLTIGANHMVPSTLRRSIYGAYPVLMQPDDDLRFQ